MMKRRHFLELLAAGAAGLSGRIKGSSASVRGPISYWARLKFPGPGSPERGWRAEPSGDQKLMQAIRERTSINMSQQWFVADVERLESLTQFPFIFMHGNYAPTLSDAQRLNLREYLLRGGFLFAEDCINSEGSRDEFFRGMAEVDFPRMFPEAKLEKLPLDHPVFHCSYDFPLGIPHMQGVEHGLQGLTINGRVLALLSPSDIHCGWTNGDQWFGPGKHAQSIQMGINIYLFAMHGGGAVNASIGLKLKTAP